MKCPRCHAENSEPSRFCRYCAAPLPPPEKRPDTPKITQRTPIHELVRGTIFAERYEVIEELGQGGIGSVYRVFDRKIEGEAALKLIRAEVASDAKTIERFRNELKITRTIAHRNVCRMYDLNVDDGAYYITMEYVPGENLKSFVRRTKRLDAVTAISIAKQICEGLAEAHRLAVIHRDLKSSNVMIDKEGNAKIMDFGIARSLATKRITDADAFIGTPECMSPEQVEGKDVDCRSDIYSLGVLLYEMVTGQAPFVGGSPFSIAEKHINEAPKDPRQLNALIPEDLSRAILKCLEKDREKRYQTAWELHSELTRIEQVSPSRESTISTQRPHVVRKKFHLFYYGAAVLVLAIVIAGIFLMTGPAEAIKSIAVLPLKNLSGDPDKEYFSEGMTDALIAELGKLQIPRVISSTSVMKYKQVGKSVPEIARELNVDALVEGSAFLLGNKARITVQLIQANPERHLWADSFERELSDVLELQADLARMIAEKIQVKLTSQKAARFKEKTPVPPDAYVAYLRGRYFWNQRTEEGFRKAIEYFQQAISVDPNYALAYVGLADAYLLSEDLPLKESMAKARAAAQKALDIDPTRAEAYATLGFASVFDWDWQAAERDFKRALELNPNYATAHHWYGNYLAWTRRFEEAIRELERARELDPLSLIIENAIAATYYYQGQFDVVIERQQQILRVDENFFRARSGLADAYVQKRMFEEAIAEYRWVAERFPRPLWLAELGYGYAAAGQKTSSQKILDQLTNDDQKAQREPSLSVYLAILCAALDQKKKAFEWLEKAFEERAAELVTINANPKLDSLRSDPRFQSLIRRMNFPKN